MKNENRDPIEFRAWRDIEPSPAFSGDVWRRIRANAAPAPSRWATFVRGWRESWAAYGATLAAATAIAALLVVVGSPSRRGPDDTPVGSLVQAYAKLAAGGDR